MQLQAVKPTLTQTARPKPVQLASSPGLTFAGSKPSSNVRFGGSDTQNIFGRFWLAVKAFFSKKSKDALDANSIEALNMAIDKLKEERLEQVVLRNEIVGSFKYQEARLKELERIAAEEWVEAEAALKVAEKEKNEARKLEFERIAGEEALQAEKADEAVKRQLEIFDQYKLRAEAARARDEELEALLKQRRQEFEDAKALLHEAEQLEKVAEVQRKLDAMNSDSLTGGDQYTEIVERIKQRKYNAEAAVEGNQGARTAEQIKARNEMRKEQEKAKAQSALDRLKAKRAEESGETQTQTQTNADPVAAATRES